MLITAMQASVPLADAMRNTELPLLVILFMALWKTLHQTGTLERGPRLDELVAASLVRLVHARITDDGRWVQYPPGQDLEANAVHVFDAIDDLYLLPNSKRHSLLKSLQ